MALIPAFKLSVPRASFVPLVVKKFFYAYFEVGLYCYQLSENSTPLTSRSLRLFANSSQTLRLT